MYIKSPCIKNCCLDTEDICMGCFRHLSEITAWQGASSDKKQQILERAQSRKNHKEKNLPSPGVSRDISNNNQLFGIGSQGDRTQDIFFRVRETC